MKIQKLIIMIAILFSAYSVPHYRELCVSYGFDKGAIFTTQGVFCVRTVHSSWDVPFLPLEGARRQHEYKSNPDPRFIPPTRESSL